MPSHSAPAAAKELNGSWNSAKFRKKLLIESIASMLGKNKEESNLSHEQLDSKETRHDSNSTVITESKTIASKHLSDKEKAEAVTRARSGASKEPNQEIERTSHGSTNTMLAKVVANVAADPMANYVEGGIEYRSLHWWQAGMLMIAETISLGILSLPKALSILGLVPGLILLVGLGGLASYTGFVIGQFKLLYPSVHSMGDAGFFLFGRVGREVLGAGQLIFIVFIMGSHILTFSIMMNAITDHVACTIVFMLVGTLVSLFFTLPRTLRGLTWLCVASFVSIITAVGTTMIGVSITKPGILHNGQHFGQGYLDVSLWPQQSIDFNEAFLAVANIVFAYAGHVAFFSFISELRNPRDFPKALALLQCSDITMYLVSSVVIYYYAGERVASPALDSANPLIRKIAYGLAIPTIVIAGVVNGHVAVKYLFVRLLRPSGWLSAWSHRERRRRIKDEERQPFSREDEEDLLHSKGAKAWGIWIAIVMVLWVVAWTISEGVPVFNDLLGLTSALFASWFTYGLSGMFFLHMNLHRQGFRVGWKEGVKPTVGKWFLLMVNLLCVAVGVVICVAGLYSSGRSIAMHAGEGMSFSCTDNSLMV